jgi:hypothetical protein
MRFSLPGNRSTWNASETRGVRPALWLLAAAVVGVLLVEVWQSSRVAELCLSLDQNRTALVQAQARLEFVQAQLDRRSTRAELAPLADQLGLAPADARQVVALPASYLLDAERPTKDQGSVPLLAWAERASRAFVPEATARVRAAQP